MHPGRGQDLEAVIVVIVRPNADLAAGCWVDHVLAYRTLEHDPMVDTLSGPRPMVPTVHDIVPSVAMSVELHE